MRRTEAVQDSGLRVIQIRQPQNNLTARQFPTSLAHARGLLAADMHKVEPPSGNGRGSMSAQAITRSLWKQITITLRERPPSFCKGGRHSRGLSGFDFPNPSTI